jgi:hypothetical protein
MGKASTKFGRPKKTKSAVDNEDDQAAGTRPVLVSGEMFAREGQKENGEENKTQAWRVKRMLERKERGRGLEGI